ncbi:MAG: hypothetical protein AAFU72_14510 [Pseudomonadota bacterium]
MVYIFRLGSDWNPPDEPRIPPPLATKDVANAAFLLAEHCRREANREKLVQVLTTVTSFLTVFVVVVGFRGLVEAEFLGVPIYYIVLPLLFLTHLLLLFLLLRPVCSQNEINDRVKAISIMEAAALPFLDPRTRRTVDPR